MKGSYKDYLYFRISKAEFETLDEKDCITKEDLKRFMIDYKDAVLNKKFSANKAARLKSVQTKKKFLNALERMLRSLIREDTKNITPYRVAKEANISYLSAKKYFEAYNITQRLEELQKDFEFRYFKEEFLD